MTDIKTIANRNSIMLKVDSSFFGATISYNSAIDGTYITLTSGSQFEDMDELGVCYYTTNANRVTYIPLSSSQLEKQTSWQGTVSYIVKHNVTDNNLTAKFRIVPTNPIFFLLEGLTAGTTYHISGYYSINGTKTIIGYQTATTKAARSTYFQFNDIVWDSSTTGYETRAQATQDVLEVTLPKAAKIYNDATNITATLTPTIKYDASSNWAANSDMEFNCRSSAEYNADLSVVIHELGHRYFNVNMTAQHGYPANKPNVVKFMEFATDCEGATWGTIYKHYYPIISSAHYDYIDNYFVTMAVDVNYLFGN